MKISLGAFAILDKFSCPKTFLRATHSSLSFLLLTHRIAVIIYFNFIHLRSWYICLWLYVYDYSLESRKAACVSASPPCGTWGGQEGFWESLSQVQPKAGQPKNCETSGAERPEMVTDNKWQKKKSSRFFSQGIYFTKEADQEVRTAMSSLGMPR